jgi:hypothetical protein
MKLEQGRYSMEVYPCGCSVGRIVGEGTVTSVGLCEEHLKELPAVDLKGIAGVVAERAAASGKATVIDTVQMGDDFVEYIRERGLVEEDVDGSA